MCYDSSDSGWVGIGTLWTTAYFYSLPVALTWMKLMAIARRLASKWAPASNVTHDGAPTWESRFYRKMESAESDPWDFCLLHSWH